jgi:hypothetical protein
MLPQPDLFTCGPTSLHAVYRFYNDEIPLHQVIAETGRLDDGGTLGVLLGSHALKRGYTATIYTFNLTVFDPTWFGVEKVDLTAKLKAQMQVKKEEKLQLASRAYIEFLSQGGKIRMKDLTAGLLRHYLRRSFPILTGLSATYLYQCARETGVFPQPDDILGLATGHFVVLCGYDEIERMAHVADPFLPNPLGSDHYYEVDLDRLVCAILLGVLTYDANFLIIRPKL